MTAPYTLAIDFGTTYTVAAIRDGAEQPQVVEIDGERRMPSTVLLAEGGTLITGTEAENQAALFPDRVQTTPKRLLGGPPVLLGDGAVEVEDLVAAVLQVVLSEARRFRAGADPAETRLTHPVRWADQRLGALREAASRAGIADPVLVHEPVAAAWFGAEKLIEPDDLVAVYDLGGGTFDTAVLRRTDEGFTVHGEPGGDEHLGGEDFDDRLLAYLGEQALDPEDWAALQAGADRDWRFAYRELRSQVRRAKESLGRREIANVPLRPPLRQPSIQITRVEFEALVRDDIFRTLDELERTIGAAGLQPTELKALYLTGGSSRIPMVKRLLWERFREPEPKTWDDPKTAVARGATLVEQVDAKLATERSARPILHVQLPTEAWFLDGDSVSAVRDSGDRWFECRERITKYGTTEDFVAAMRLQEPRQEREVAQHPVFGQHPGVRIEYRNLDANSVLSCGIEDLVVFENRAFMARYVAAVEEWDEARIQALATLDDLSIDDDALMPTVAAAETPDGSFSATFASQILLADIPSGWRVTEEVLVSSPDEETWVRVRKRDVDDEPASDPSSIADAGLSVFLPLKFRELNREPVSISATNDLPAFRREGMLKERGAQLLCIQVFGFTDSIVFEVIGVTDWRNRDGQEHRDLLTAIESATVDGSLKLTL